MKFVIEKKPSVDGLNFIISFNGEVTADDFLKLKLSAFDTLLLEDITLDKNASVADYLLGLEMIFRRLEEQK